MNGDTQAKVNSAKALLGNRILLPYIYNYTIVVTGSSAAGVMGVPTSPPTDIQIKDVPFIWQKTAFYASTRNIMAYIYPVGSLKMYTVTSQAVDTANGFQANFVPLEHISGSGYFPSRAKYGRRFETNKNNLYNLILADKSGAGTNTTYNVSLALIGNSVLNSPYNVANFSDIEDQYPSTSQITLAGNASNTNTILFNSGSGFICERMTIESTGVFQCQFDFNGNLLQNDWIHSSNLAGETALNGLLQFYLPSPAYIPQQGYIRTRVQDLSGITNQIIITFYGGMTIA